MKNILCMVIIAIIVTSGCAVLKRLELSSPSIQSEGSITEAPSTATKEAAQKLPPEADSSAAHQQLEFAVHVLACKNNRESRTGKISLEAFNKASAKARLHSILITNCELDHLKALIALKEAPIIIVKNEQAGQFVFVAVTAYNNEDKQVTLRNFYRRNIIVRMKYSRFEAHWKKTGTPQKALILSPRSVKVAQIKRALAVYLPSRFEAHWKKTGTPQKALILSPRSVKVAQIKRALAVYLPKEKLANLIFH
jgi:hypothetical protein